ncbi:hypothetical protein JKP88DRAFT_173091 [Tribonema minus]|uniref:Tudor domain-containing protein n=1 Tax=Tribonema minus TaxID=303371 RepID=A0A835ZKM7_9STRA|nr:hypothetical protein JKP88DRAFT_173091 [Tribonema minus]
MTVTLLVTHARRHPLLACRARRAAPASDFLVGDKVEGNYKGRGKWFAGTVAALHRDGTYDIDYADGDRETSMEAARLRLLQRGAAAAAPRRAAEAEAERNRRPVAPGFARGDAVETRYRGRGEYLSGRIARVNRDDTVDVDYDDGRSEFGVAAELVRAASSDDDRRGAGRGAAAAAPPPLREGDKVEARFKGRARYFSGKIRRVNRDGTYDVDYDDGEKELSVAADLIKSLEPPPRRAASPHRADSLDDNGGARAAAAAAALREGDKVEARYKGRARYFSGKIRCVNRDGTYDVDYDDGEKELSVAADLIRSLEPPPSTAAARSPRAAAAVDFRAGDKIEARYRGRERYFKGEVRRVNRDGTYDIDYDDGEKELGVAAALIRAQVPLLEASAPQQQRGGSAEPLAEGDRVEARYKGRARYFSGKVRRANRDGTYDVDYDDGEKELSVAVDLIRSLEPPPRHGAARRADSLDDGGRGSAAAAAAALREGDKVEARYKGRARYYSGKIRRVNRDGTYDVDYDDGEKELSVAADLIRSLESSSGRADERDRITTSSGGGGRGGTPREGDKVEARYRGRERWFGAKVRKVNRDGTYDVDYDDGGCELDVRPEFVRLLSAAAAAAAGDGDRTDGGGSSGAARSPPLMEGDKVEARYKGRTRYYPGKIQRANRDGTYDVDYDDGEKELSVAADLIKSLEPPPRRGESVNEGLRVSSSAAAAALIEGDKVEARYKGRARYYPGKLRRANRDGTYDVDYDDGEKELSVAAELIRSLEPPRRSPARIDSSSALPLREGDKVEARYKGRARHYPGKIRRVNRDGTYDVDYDDGEKELSMAADLIKSLEADARRTESVNDGAQGAAALREGDKVEARYKGRARFFPGKIRRVNRDGTYDVDYDDGEKELSVAADLIRSLEVDGRRPDSGGARGGGASAAALREGDKVEARYKGRARYYTGKIRRANRDGTYDVDYDDGEKELSVAADFIRSLEGGGGGGRHADSLDDGGRGSAAAAAAAVLREGDKVEARYKGRARYYPGKIRRANRDGTYDIDYDDGEKELSVAADLIRSLEPPPRAGIGSPSRAAETPLQVGDKIEARYRGRERYFKGEVRRVNRDGTYDIDYDDGEKELGVAAALVRAQVLLLEAAAPGSPGRRGGDAAAALREGNRVEARYRGRARYYPGKVRRANRDGTYDIDYDDGEKELSVAADFVKSLEPPPRQSPPRRVDSLDDGGRGSAAAAVLREGDKVEARYKGRARYYPGKIRCANRDGTYDVDYDDGEKELSVAADLIKSLEPARGSAAGGGGGARDAGSSGGGGSSSAQFRAGDRVEARFRGRARWFAARVRAANRDGTYDVEYDDGDKEDGVAAEMLRFLDAAPAAAAAAKAPERPAAVSPRGADLGARTARARAGSYGG